MSTIEDPQTREMFEMMGEPFVGETLFLKGWVYRDIPWMEDSEYLKMIDIIGGTKNYRMLAGSTRQGRCRAQLIISPEGFANLKAYQERDRGNEG